MPKSTGAAGDVVGFLVEGIPALSQSAREFVLQRPREARLAVVVALETAAVQCETEDSSTAGVPEQLRRFVVRRYQGDDTIGVSEAAARLNVSRTTVYDWVDKKVLLAWRSTKRGLSIPAAQILGRGRVVPGLADVLESIGDPELAWAFLTQEWPFEDTAMPPLELLKVGRTEEVVGAACGFGSSFL